LTETYSCRAPAFENVNGNSQPDCSYKHLRKIIGGDEFMYMPGEPIIEEDWAAFMTQYELVKADPELILPWPPKYPSDDME